MRMLLLTSLAACGANESSVPGRPASSYCASLKTCDEMGFWRTYTDGTSDCVAEMTETISDLGWSTDTRICQWDQAQADACLTDLRDATCQEIESTFWVSECFQAWDCVWSQ